jgi:Cytochrome c/c1 heme lyase
VYNVYNQRIDEAEPSKLSTSYAAAMDPKNNMPTVANQRPAPGQRAPLSTNRQPSTIPKGGTDSTWLYPSPQMFYNGASHDLLLHRCTDLCDATRLGSSKGALPEIYLSRVALLLLLFGWPHPPSRCSCHT